jgi:hypothetical protein
MKFTIITCGLEAPRPQLHGKTLLSAILYPHGPASTTSVSCQVSYMQPESCCNANDHGLVRCLQKVKQAGELHSICTPAYGSQTFAARQHRTQLMALHCPATTNAMSAAPGCQALLNPRVIELLTPSTPNSKKVTNLERVCFMHSPELAHS